MEKREISVPHVDKVVGKEPLNTQNLWDRIFFNEKGEQIKNAAEILHKIFFEEGSRKIDDFELKKTERDIELIKIVNDAILGYLKKLERSKNIDIPLDNIHFLEEGGVEKYTNGRLRTGSHASLLGSILIERRSDIETALTLFHESWHAKVYQAIQFTNTNELDDYRSGILIRSRDGNQRWFYYLEEALTGLMTKRFYEEVILRHPFFEEELNKTKETPDTTRVEEAEDLDQFIRKIFEQNKDDFKDKNAILTLFYNAQVNGRLLPLARLIEKTFGKGAFRKMGEHF